MANNYPLRFLCMVFFGEVFFSVFSSALGCLSRCYSCHPFVSQFFDVMLEKFSANYPALHQVLDTYGNLPCLLSNHFSGYFYVVLFYFISFLSAIQHFYCDSFLFPKYYSKISYFPLCQTFCFFQVFDLAVGTLFFDFVGTICSII